MSKSEEIVASFFKESVETLLASLEHTSSEDLDKLRIGLNIIFQSLQAMTEKLAHKDGRIYLRLDSEENKVESVSQDDFATFFKRDLETFFEVERVSWGTVVENQELLELHRQRVIGHATWILWDLSNV